MTEKTEVAVVETILQPMTGELVPVGDIAKIAEALDQLRQHKREVETAISAFTEAALEISRQTGTKTLHAGALTVRLSAESTIEWDVTALVRLLKAGLPQERYDELVVETVTHKVNGNVARQIAGSNPAYARIIERAKVKVPKRVSANVS